MNLTPRAVVVALGVLAACGDSATEPRRNPYAGTWSLQRTQNDPPWVEYCTLQNETVEMTGNGLIVAENGRVLDIRQYVKNLQIVADTVVLMSRELSGQGYLVIDRPDLPVGTPADTGSITSSASGNRMEWFRRFRMCDGEIARIDRYYTFSP